MRALRVAIVGFGRLGRACASAIGTDDQLVLAGIVRRPETVSQALPAAIGTVPAVAHVSELADVEAALVCVPRQSTRQTVHDLLQRGVPVVECAQFEGEELIDHKQALAHMASRFEVPAIIGAGWDPGALSLFRHLFALLTPKGHTDISHRPGTSLHHTTIARAVPGVKDTLCIELRAAGGPLQRYVYVELEKGARFEDVETAIRSDPLFLGEETLVFPVDSVATLEDEDHGVLMERRGTAGRIPHQLLLLEARFSEPALCAQCMLAAARALPTCKSRGYTLFDLPPGALWGRLRAQAERDWL